MATTKFTTALSILFFCIALFMPTDARLHRRSPDVTSVRRDWPGNSAYPSGYSVPLSNGSASLPAPASTATLRAIAIGRGTQNYTCTGASTAAPVSIGAVATVFDAGFYLQYLPPAEGTQLLDILPGYFLSLPLSLLQASPIPQLGQHYVLPQSIAVFNLTQSIGGLFYGTKTSGILAPANSAQGANGVIDWFELSAKPGLGSVDLSTIFRVVTAGGKPPSSCAGQPAQIQVDYATQYWFYN